MTVILENEFYKRAENLLRNTCPFTQDKLHKYLHPNAGKSLLECIDMPNNYAKADESKKKESIVKSIAEGMEVFMRHLPMPPSLKQHTYVDLCNWIKAAADYYDIKTLDINEYISAPIKEDTSIGMLKLFHERRKFSKEELKEELKVTPRTVQTCLRSLDPALSVKENTKIIAARFAGQKVYAKIDCEGGKGKLHRYEMENTIHPVAMQLNVMQVGVLLKSLQASVYDGDSLVGRGIALDIWAQLTDYAKDRVKTVFAEKDEEFLLFIEELEDDIISGEVPMFKTEAELLKEGDVNLHDELLMIMKANRTCDVLIKKDGVRITISKCKIRPGITTDYVAEPAVLKGQNKEEIPLNEDDVLDVNIYY